MSTSALHSKQDVADGIHMAVALEFTNATTRAAGTVANPSGYVISAVSVGMIARQLDDDSFYILKDDSPLTWTALGSAGAVTVKSTLAWGNSGVSSTTTARYLSPFYDDALAPTTVIQWRVPYAGTLKNLRVRHNVTAGNGNAIVYTLRKNGTASALTCSVNSTAADGSDTSNSVTVAAGDLVDIEVTKAASIGTSPSDIMASMEYDAT